MQAFYNQLSVTSPQAQQRRLAGLTRISRVQVLEATRGLTWLIWGAERDTASA